MHQKARVERVMQGDEVEAVEIETGVKKRVKLKMGQTLSLNQ